MTPRAYAAAAALLLAGPVLGGAAPAATGVRCAGTIVVQTTVQGQPLTVGGNVAFYRKGSLYRLDVLSLGIPGAGSDLSALAATFIGPGGASGVYDSATGALTAWSNANHTYYTATPAPRAAAARTTATPAPSGPTDPLSVLASIASNLRDVQSATIQLTGHGPVNGHPATNLDFQMKRQLPGKPAENYHAQLALADDFDEFPLQIVVQSIAANTSTFGGTAKLDLTSVQPDNPDDATFRAPAGYTRVTSLGALFGANLPH